MHKRTNEEICFLREMAPGRSYRELHKIVQESFDILVTKSALNGTLKRYGIRNGIDQTFKKNHVPHNKGQGGIHYPGSEKGWFQKGNIPWNYKPIGAERINQDGYIEIKTNDPNVWTPKHVLLWKEHNGEVPPGHVVVIIGKNRTNPQLEDLMLVSRKQLAIMNKRKLLFADKEVAESGKLLSALILKKGNAKKRTKRKTK